MLRKSKVHDYIKRKCQNVTKQQIEFGFDGITAAEVANEIGLDRANTSKELNQLQQEGLLIKTMGRPVYYFDVPCMEQILHKKITKFETNSLCDLMTDTFDEQKDDFFILLVVKKV